MIKMNLDNLRILLSLSNTNEDYDFKMEWILKNAKNETSEEIKQCNEKLKECEYKLELIEMIKTKLKERKGE